MSELTTLPHEGRYVVETAHSAYLIDCDAHTFERRRVNPDASELHNDGDPLTYHRIDCAMGQSMDIDYMHNGRLWWRTTTPVTAIRDAE